MYYRPSDRVHGNFQQYHVEESNDYAEKTLDYVEMSKIDKVVPLAFSKVYKTR